MPDALAFRYARALADLASQPGAAADTDAVSRELETFTGALEASTELRVALQLPSVPPARKRAVVSRLAAMLSLSDLVRRFLLVVVNHRRVPLLPDIREAFETVMDERLGVARAEIVSARELSDGQRSEIISGLERLTGKRIRARFLLREGLIGGVVARIGSTVYDGSVRGQLEALKHRMAAGG